MRKYFLRFDVPSSKVVIIIEKKDVGDSMGITLFIIISCIKHKCMIYQSEWNNIFSFG